MSKQIVYHGSYLKVIKPKIIEGKYFKDFGTGFYCTILDEQAIKWAKKYETPILNIYEYDIVIGAMADDQVYNYISDLIEGNITREAFWELAKFKHPTHQIAFCTQDALETLTFIEEKELD